MTEPSSISIKKSHLYIAIGIVLSLFVLLISNKSTSTDVVENQNPYPAPTETVFVPTQGNNYNFGNDTQNQLDELRAQNCRLSQDLLLQSMDLSRQAEELDWASDGFDNFDQIQNLRTQSMNLLVKSQELANDC
jgi:hypothetical protein